MPRLAPGGLITNRSREPVKSAPYAAGNPYAK